MSQNRELPITVPYTQIEYLQSDGQSWIDTGIIPNSTFGFEVDVQPLQNNADLIPVGSWKAWRNKMFGSNFAFTQSKFYASYSQYDTNVSYTSTDRVILWTQSNVIKLGNSTFTINGGQSFTSESSIYIFAASVNGGTSTAKAPSKIWYCKIWEGTEDNLVRDFIPVRVGQVGYMYDKVSGQLFGNAGTGSFVVGPDIT